jgi:Sec-independent protein translocase protein TatA
MGSGIREFRKGLSGDEESEKKDSGESDKKA